MVYSCVMMGAEGGYKSSVWLSKTSHTQNTITHNLNQNGIRNSTNTLDKEETNNINTDKVIDDYVKITDKRNKISSETKINPCNKTKTEMVQLNNNRFFYSGADWTLNLLPTILIITIAFIAGTV